MKPHKFTDGTNIGALYKFKHVFQANERDARNFRKFNTTRITQSVINYTITAADIVLLAVVVSESCDACTYDFSGYHIAGALILGSGIVLINNVAAESIKSRRKKKLFDQFSGEFIDFSHRESYPNLNLEITQNGIGLVVRF
ncbi:MAG: hypothetical protein HKN09_05405 [Saprospiraceae bacterium]|nr:hypothetical protein [Saprospiraceae bacterium]